MQQTAGMGRIIRPKHKTALILGCGASGVACARFLANRGWQLILADTRENFVLPEAARNDLPRILAEYYGALDSSQLLTANGRIIDLVVISPGLSPVTGQAAPVIAQARAQQIPVVGEIELFARELQRLADCRAYRPKVLAITGTNGKTTTTVMTGLMAKASGVSVCVAGNIGPNAIAELDTALQSNTLPDVWVLELSSFQLETTESLKPTAAAFLNLTEDHVDWHGSMDAYAQAKRKIFKQASVAVINREDPMTQVGVVGSDSTFAGRVMRFGLAPTEQSGDWGLNEHEGLSWLTYQEWPRPDAGRKEILKAEGARTLHLMPRDHLKIQGRHNVMNALAALALIEGAGLPMGPALRALSVYQGEAHRVQKVGTVDGVDFIDDSKGTNVGAVLAALKGFAADGKRCHLILGGDGKGQDFSPLKSAIQDGAGSVAVIGRDGPLIQKALAGITVPVVDCGVDFEKAVRDAWQAAQPGDVVLLSPACASWDMFSNYAQRSARFVEIMKAIEQEVSAE